jgi:hypothetical protein
MPENAAQLALEKIQSGVTYPLQKEASEAEKSAATLAGQKTTEDYIKQIASQGLSFSGIKEKGLKTIEADTLAKQLGIDRSFALLMAQGIESGVKQIASEAAKGRTEAINALEAAGYTIVGGKVVPTLAREKTTEPTDTILTPTEAATLGVPYGTTRGQAATMGITPARYKETAEKITDAERVNKIRTFIDSKRGTDKLIAAGTYIKAAQDWISIGGTSADFKMAFPAESLMRKEELKKLPTSLKPSKTTTTSLDFDDL